MHIHQRAHAHASATLPSAYYPQAAEEEKLQQKAAAKENAKKQKEVQATKKLAGAAIDMLKDPIAKLKDELRKHASTEDTFLLQTSQLVEQKVKEMMNDSLTVLTADDPAELKFDLKDVRNLQSEMAIKTRMPA